MTYRHLFVYRGELVVPFDGYTLIYFYAPVKFSKKPRIYWKKSPFFTLKGGKKSGVSGCVFECVLRKKGRIFNQNAVLQFVLHYRCSPPTPTQKSILPQPKKLPHPQFSKCINMHFSCILFIIGHSLVFLIIA